MSPQAIRDEAFKAWSDCDNRKAISLYLQLVRTDEADAEVYLRLAALHNDNQPETRSPMRHSYWMKRLALLAESGDAKAQYVLEGRYRWGDQLPADWDLANQWLTRAAGSGLPAAQYDLSLYLRDGSYGLPRDTKAAEMWHRKAIENDHPEALYMEALKGVTLGKADATALALLRRAAAKHFMPAIELLQSNEQ